MAYHHWLKYNSIGTTVEIIIRDDSGAKLDSFKINSKDKKSLRKILRLIREKYAIDFTPEFKDNERDLEWLK